MNDKKDMIVEVFLGQKNIKAELKSVLRAVSENQAILVDYTFDGKRNKRAALF